MHSRTGSKNESRARLRSHRERAAAAADVRLKITLYLSETERDKGIGAALTEGFRRHGETVVSITKRDYFQPDPQTQVAVVIGIRRRNKRIMAAYKAESRHCILLEKSYFGRTEFMRWSVDGFQPAYLHATPRPDDRWRRIRDDWRIDVRPKRAQGRHLVYAGSSQKYNDWHELGDGNEYAKGVCHAINKQTHSTLPLHYRAKPGWVINHPQDVQRLPDTVFSGPEQRLADLLPGCQALVTHGSNAAVEAVVAGVPVCLVSHEGVCAAWRVADKGVEKIYDPWFPDDAQRQQWLNDLAYCQFSIEEFRNGKAWEIVKPETLKSGDHSWAGLPPLESVVAQYKAMHESGKVFRGGSIRGHLEALRELVARHQPATLLDYGCGKGLQYSDWKVHESWGGLLPHCYDPGVAEFSTKPAGRFDAVICTDVIEHIPPEAVDQVYGEAIGYAAKFAFFCIFTGPARKHLPDGRNCHLTQRPRQWWIDKTVALAGGTVERTFDLAGPLPGGGYETHPHWVIRAASGVEIVLTFRQEE
jgi:hypothetical protein